MRSVYRLGLKTLRIGAPFLACVCITATVALAQGGSATATLSGRVVDESGAVLPGVSVTVTNLSNNQSRSFVTNEEGLYRFTGLPPSQYSLKAELQGFATFVVETFTLNIGAAGNVDATMKVSSISETVTVTGEAPIVERARRLSAP